jgi:hypothetical protein
METLNLMFPYVESKGRFMRTPCSLDICMCIPYIVDSQRLGKNVSTEQNTQATIEELLELSFSLLQISKESKGVSLSWSSRLIINILIFI